MTAISSERQDLVRRHSRRYTPLKAYGKYTARYSQDYVDEQILAWSRYRHFGQIKLVMKESNNG